jgi:hypothetical protein
MAALRAFCNGTGTPDFSKIQTGDYLDRIDLPAISAENGGTAKGVGDTEVTKNHIRFDFANVPLMKLMNPSNDNTGGYAATEVRVFLEGVTTAAFLKALKAQIGDYILPVRRLFSNGAGSWMWVTCSLWLPSENEIFGANAWGESGYGDEQKLYIPLYRDSYAYRIKRYNGSWFCGQFLC